MTIPAHEIRAVLFDVGGPLNTEVEHERLVDADLIAVAREAGIEVTGAGYEAAVAWAVHSYAPDAHSAIAWRLAGGDPVLAARLFAAFRARATARQIPFDLRPGMADVLARLHGRGLRLGIAANQPVHTLSVLDDIGIGRYFHHREVSGTHGFLKPDARLFLRACDDLGVKPQQCIMVGDRIDNDIAPARRLGMRAVLFRTGRHIAQQPRSHEEVPHAEVRDVTGLQAALEWLLDGQEAPPGDEAGGPGGVQ